MNTPLWYLTVINHLDPKIQWRPYHTKFILRCHNEKFITFTFMYFKQFQKRNGLYCPITSIEGISILIPTCFYIWYGHHCPITSTEVIFIVIPTRAWTSKIHGPHYIEARVTTEKKVKYAENPEVGKICMSLVLELATLVVTIQRNQQ